MHTLILEMYEKCQSGKNEQLINRLNCMFYMYLGPQNKGCFTEVMGVMEVVALQEVYCTYHIKYIYISDLV